jgi:predicted MPP superfamily phosphohydrolase
LSAFPTRRKFLQVCGAGTTLGAIAVAGDGVFLEPNQPQVVSLDVPLARLPEAWDGFRIAQLSDFHYDEHFSVVPIRKAIDILNRLQPDMVVLTGDFVSAPLHLHRRRGSSKERKAAAKAIEPCAQLLSQLRARSGVFAVHGNHDAGTDPAYITSVLQSHGIPVLTNRSVALDRHQNESQGNKLWVCGVDDVLDGKANLALALSGIPPADPVVLLAHEPDWADYVVNYPVDLQLSGHSHGGQVRIPLIGAPFLPELARKYPWGLRRIGPLTLYTNAGLGTIRIPLRLNCPPEITLITLRAA